jgi:hypothetical protein
MISLRILAGSLLACWVATLPAWTQTRFHNYTCENESAPDQARVVSSSLFGADGVEWFSGGGFQPDGTIVAAGTTLGPRLTLDGSEKVLGKDQSAPPAPAPVPAMSKGKPLLRDDGTPVYEKFRWNHEQATGFIARFSADGAKLIGVTRLPWKSGAINEAAVDSKGNIYITGPALPGAVETWGLTPETWKSEAEPDPKAAAPATYLARLSPDAGKIEWVRVVSQGSPAPGISIDDQDQIFWQGADLRVVDPAGKLVRTVTVPGGLSGKVAVHPTNGTYARYGERHSGTGREPWRCPILNIFEPDGTWALELYNWSGPVVGLDSYRLVSDSAVRGVGYDHEGNLILHAWSDGGNSVMLREPFDLSQVAPGFKGMGWSAWGANVLSCAYVIKLDTTTWRVKHGTLLAAFLPDRDKPNSLWIDAMGIAADGAVCLAGRSAAGLIQTGNHIGGIDPAKGGIPSGEYVKILRPDLSGLLFASAIPATGRTDLGNGSSWAIASGKIGGKTRVLYLSSSGHMTDLYGVTYTTPLRDSAQKEFGGGETDAYFLLLELAPATGKTP